MSSRRRVLGDFDADGVWDPDDLDLLATADQANSTDPFFDLNNDGMVTFEIGASGGSDSDYWLDTLFGSEYDEFNLDEKVDGTDYSTLLGNFGVVDEWAEGDVME